MPDPLPEGTQATKLTVRAATEEECRSGNAVWRWLIVRADDPDQTLYDAGMLGLVPEGADHLLVAIQEARVWERRRGYELVLSEEVRLLADALLAIYDELDQEREGRETSAGRIARLIFPSILWSDRMADRAAERRAARKRRQAAHGMTTDA